MREQYVLAQDDKNVEIGDFVTVYGIDELPHYDTEFQITEVIEHTELMESGKFYTEVLYILSNGGILLF